MCSPFRNIIDQEPDDLVDSRWTLTVVGAALLDAGSGPVSPFVLARSVSD